MTFEQSLERLEAITHELEKEGIPLERALQLFEEGIEHLKHASSELARAEAKVKVLTQKADGTLVLKELRG
jgi:exodeoxyribonuclease VII small subunit